MAGQKFVRVRRFAENAVYVGKKDRRDPHAARAAAQAFLQGGGDRRQDRFPQARAVQQLHRAVGGGAAEQLAQEVAFSDYLHQSL